MKYLADLDVAGVIVLVLLVKLLAMLATHLPQKEMSKSLLHIRKMIGYSCS